ncbi:MAG: helix-turn-helix domain-containing protein [Stellaceae bacterium]
MTEIRPVRRRSVGQLLRETRESYGSDIPRVASALRIRAAYLEAIEEGHYDRLPGPVYALGFVRAYAVHLGLDGEEAVRRFKLEAEGFEAQRDLSFPVPLAERSIPGGAMVLAAVILAVCAYGIWYYLSSTARPRPERVGPVPAELAKPATPAAPVAPAAPSLAAAPPAPAAAAPPAALPPAVDALPAPASPPPPSAEATAPPPAPVPPAAAAVPSSPVAAPSAPVAPTPAPSPSAGPTVSDEDVPVAAAPSPPVAAAPTPPVAASPPAQTAALPSVPGGGATPVPDEPRVYGSANGETRILIRALSDSWIQIRDRDHKPIFTRQLRAGDTYHVPDEPGVTMKTGKGAGLVITVDGRQTPPIGGAVRPNVYLDPDRLLAGTAVAD